MGRKLSLIFRLTNTKILHLGIAGRTDRAVGPEISDGTPVRVPEGAEKDSQQLPSLLSQNLLNRPLTR
jgi:hypothetical protein